MSLQLAGVIRWPYGHLRDRSGRRDRLGPGWNRPGTICYQAGNHRGIRKQGRPHWRRPRREPRRPRREQLRGLRATKGVAAAAARVGRRRAGAPARLGPPECLHRARVGPGPHSHPGVEAVAAKRSAGVPRGNLRHEPPAVRVRFRLLRRRSVRGRYAESVSPPRRLRGADEGPLVRLDGPRAFGFRCHRVSDP